MNKILIVGRLTRDPETQVTNSGIKYTRFTIAVSRQFGENQTDFIPIVAWRSQAEFVENYIKKGAMISVEGRFTSSSYLNSENQQITRYEVTADRVEGLESKSQVEAREHSTHYTSVVKAPSNDQVVEFEKEENNKNEEEENDVPWELDL
ncbi:MAG: single-stranded DNA-binding protein [Mycoplasmatales bacterium]|nr:single-stranded DNA-binding protein [Mycoplasmatales bacterium]